MMDMMGAIEHYAWCLLLGTVGLVCEWAAVADTTPWPAAMAFLLLGVYLLIGCGVLAWSGPVANDGGEKEE